MQFVAHKWKAIFCLLLSQYNIITILLMFIVFFFQVRVLLVNTLSKKSLISHRKGRFKTKLLNKAKHIKKIKIKTLSYIIITGVGNYLTNCLYKTYLSIMLFSQL